MLDRGRRMLHRCGRVLHRGRRVLDRSRRMLHRGRLRRLVDHRPARAAVAGRAAGALTLDDGARVRRGRRMATDIAPGSGTTLNGRTLSARRTRAVRPRDTASPGR